MTAVPTVAQGRLKWYSSDNKELVFGAIQFCSGDVWLVSDLGEQLHIAAVYVRLTQDDQVTESSKSCSLSPLSQWVVASCRNQVVILNVSGPFWEWSLVTEIKFLKWKFQFV